MVNKAFETAALILLVLAAASMPRIWRGPTAADRMAAFLCAAVMVAAASSAVAAIRLSVSTINISIVMACSAFAAVFAATRGHRR